jgi:hypothetical protein
MTPDTSLQVSDLKERQARLYVTLDEIEGPPLPLIVSSMERLAGLLEKAEPILQATMPTGPPDPFHPPQTLASEDGSSISTKP